MPEPSLRSGLIARFLGAALILLLLDAVACYAIAAHFANQVYDRWLIDSTRALAQALRVDAGNLRLDLPQVAQQIVQFDEVDKTYFRVTSDRGGLLGGDVRLPILTVPADARAHLITTDVRGEELRIVATRVPMAHTADVATVEVGETLHKRAALTTDILLAMAAPQLGLLLVAPLFAWFGVTQGLKPLDALGAEIETRGHDNLTPVPDRPWPREARVLVTKINDLLRRLQASMVAQRRFLADAAHQLRTPLAAVLLFIERAERAPDAESARQALQGLRTSASRAARLVHQLLALARAEPDAAPVRRLDAIDLVGLARGVGEEWIPRALERKIDFGFVAPDEPVVVAGNAGLLGELMSNLIDNALRYAGPSSHVTVSVEASPAPALHVEDDGPGIPESECEKIFERFYRLADNRAEGCGLGLSIVREIETQHRAVTRVTRGRDGRGARFTVQFPPLVERSV